MKKLYLTLLVALLLVVGVYAGVTTINKIISIDKTLLAWGTTNGITGLTYSEKEMSNGKIFICVTQGEKNIGCKATNSTASVKDIEAKIIETYLAHEKLSSESKPTVTKETIGTITLEEKK